MGRRLAKYGIKAKNGVMILEDAVIKDTRSTSNSVVNPYDRSFTSSKITVTANQHANIFKDHLQLDSIMVDASERKIEAEK